MLGLLGTPSPASLLPSSLPHPEPDALAHCGPWSASEASFLGGPPLSLPGWVLTDLCSHLPGQDIFVCGLMGALQGALLCSSAILKRNLFLDLKKLDSRIRAQKKKN